MCKALRCIVAVSEVGMVFFFMCLENLQHKIRAHQSDSTNLICFYDKITYLVYQGIISWISGRFLQLFLTVSILIKYPA